MCRLLTCNREYLESKTKEEMKEFLDVLEKSCGGHGNGILFIKDGEIELFAKGTELTNQDIVDMLYCDRGYFPDWFMYHTRVASVSSVKDSNCHPYVNKDKSFALMMNGTDRSFGAIGELEDKTDTEIIFNIFNTMNYDVAALKNLSPRFMGFKNNKVFVTNPSSMGLKYQNIDGAICIASEFPLKYKDVKSLKNNYYWEEGQELKEEPVRVVRSYANVNSFYGYDNYGYYGFDLPDDYYTVGKEDKKEIEPEDEPEEADYGEKEFTKEEFLKLIKKIKAKRKKLSFTKLQDLLDETFGLFPIVDGKYIYLLALETKQIVIEDEEGNLVEI